VELSTVREKLCGFSDGFGSDDDHICLFTVKLKEIGMHPGFNITEAVGDSRVGDGGDGFGGDTKPKAEHCRHNGESVDNGGKWRCQYGAGIL